MNAKISSDLSQYSALQLAITLWSWDVCRDCTEEKRVQCENQNCLGSRITRIQRYLKYYEAVISTYIDATSTSTRNVKTHSDIFTIISILKSHSDATLSELRQLASPSTNTNTQADAIAIGVKTMLMIDPSALHRSSDRLEKGTFRVHWKEDVPLSKYIQDSFPIEQLRVTRDLGDCSSPSSSLKKGVLPRQLVLEILDSLQGTLFPLSDPKSKKLARSLIKKCSFDPDILKFEVSSVRRIGEESVPYVYLADRLADLYNELQTPRPRSWLQRSMQRKSGARHVMMATLIGVVFAITLGMASLAVSSYQTWIAYQAWKHPVEPH
ncbi:hypothetical protein EDB82DRAFT_471592 [Fusarium venenatum]|uniref:uncharacterized protein n=1 Tax=Fusarium venenatum TaxID=56646 RepID=UPI001D67C2FD|nr:hypothetical protein EDB82DRAFT_471592 [Fusarium venenatum]